jgi:hypothetical protein
MALRLAKDGWWGGDPGKVMDAPVEDVLDALAYERFRSEYESETMRLNRAEER